MDTDYETTTNDDEDDETIISGRLKEHMDREGLKY